MGPAAAERSLGDGGVAATRPEAPRARKPGGPGTQRGPGTAGTPPTSQGEPSLRATSRPRSPPVFPVSVATVTGSSWAAPHPALCAPALCPRRSPPLSCPIPVASPGSLPDSFNRFLPGCQLSAALLPLPFQLSHLWAPHFFGELLVPSGGSLYHLGQVPNRSAILPQRRLCSFSVVGPPPALPDCICCPLWMTTLGFLLPQKLSTATHVSPPVLVIVLPLTVLT